MNTIQVFTQSYAFNRDRTLATLGEIEKLPEPQAALAYRPGPGRAHLAWQFMHIGVTEDIFASERLAPEKRGKFSALWPRFRGGSQADDEIPSVAQIREVLAGTRAHLLDTLATLSEDQLGIVPAHLAEKKWSYGTVLQIIAWHEGHHQGQAHSILNGWKRRG